MFSDIYFLTKYFSVSKTRLFSGFEAKEELEKLISVLHQLGHFLLSIFNSLAKGGAGCEFFKRTNLQLSCQMALL